MEQRGLSTAAALGGLVWSRRANFHRFPSWPGLSLHRKRERGGSFAAIIPSFPRKMSYRCLPKHVFKISSRELSSYCYGAFRIRLISRCAWGSLTL